MEKKREKEKWTTNVLSKLMCTVVAERLQHCVFRTDAEAEVAHFAELYVILNEEPETIEAVVRDLNQHTTNSTSYGVYTYGR